MISTPNTILRKLNRNIDLLFIKEKGYIQFAIEVEHPKELPQMLDKLKKATTGLYIKANGEYLLRNTTDISNVTVHQIPPTIKSLQHCCEWIYKNYTPNPEYSLGSIAADNTRIVVNSCHTLTDGSFFQHLLSDVSDDSKKFDSIYPSPLCAQTDLLKPEFDGYLAKRQKYVKTAKPFIQSNFTYVNIEENPQIPNRDDPCMVRFTEEMNPSELAIYDASRKKVSHMTEFLWTALTMSISAMNGSFGPLGIGSVMDLRRLIPKSRVDERFGSAFVDFYLSVGKPSQKKTIAEICNEFRSRFNEIESNQGFFEQFLNPFEVKSEGKSICSVSNVGFFEFKKPIKDFYSQFFGNETMIRAQTQVTSWAKVRKDTGVNKCVFQYFFSPKIISKKTGNDLFKTFVYFIKNVNPNMKAGDAYNELINYKNSLL